MQVISSKQIRKRKSQYKFGRGGEYRVVYDLRSKGYKAWRMYASKGSYDVIAIKATKRIVDDNILQRTAQNYTYLSEVLIIQVKLGKNPTMTKQEIENLRQDAKMMGATPIHAYPNPLSRKKGQPKIHYIDVTKENE